jgi:AraC family transcriptional regulator
MANASVAEFHRCIPDRGYLSLWRGGSSSAPPGYGPRHRNPGFELTWVRDGVLAFELGSAQTSISAKTGGCIVVPPGELNRPWAQASIFQVMLSPSTLEEACAQLGVSRALPQTAFGFSSSHRVSALAGLIAQARRDRDDDDPLVDALTHSLVLSLVAPEPVSRTRRDARIDRALEFIAAHAAEPISVDDVAEASELPRFVLMRRFKAQTGSSVYQHLQQVRLERAAHLLATSRDSVLEVALACGFGDPGRFARAFHKRFGAMPAAYRARIA